LLILTDEESKKIQQECDTLLKAKQIINSYTSHHENSNALKIKNYVDDPTTSIGDPLSLLQHDLKTTKHTLDMVFLIKQSNALNLN